MIVRVLFTSIHRELGHGPGPFTPGMITDAVAARLAETDDLDWKSKLYEEKNLNQTDFPKDVAAMANRGGGVIVLGVEEADKKATKIVDVGKVTEGYERTLASVAVSAISPPVFGVIVQPITTDQGTVVAVVVPGSSDGPHLIYRNHYFGAPVRNGPDTEWMKERQIEAMYRARFDARRNAANTLEALYREALAGRDTTERAWFIGVAHPRLPIVDHTRPPAAKAQEIFNAAIMHSLSLVLTEKAKRPLHCVDESHLRAGLRRWVAPNSQTGRNSWAESWISVHHDGSVTVTTSIGGRPGIPSGLPGNFIESPEFEAAIADLMGVIRATCVLRGTDEFDVRIGVESEHPDPLLIGYVDDFNNFVHDFSTPIARYTPVTATIRPGDDWNSFHQQAQDLMLDCVNQGGLTQLRAFNE